MNNHTIEKNITPSYLSVSRVGTSREYLDGPDGVAVLLYTFDQNGLSVLLPRQERLPLLSKQDSAWIYELPAGIIDPEETPEQAAVREVHEETGLTISKNNLRRIGRFATSPGRTNEFITLFMCRVDDMTGFREFGGLPDEIGSIKNNWIPLETVQGYLRENRITDKFSRMDMKTAFAIETVLRIARW